MKLSSKIADFADYIERIISSMNGSIYLCGDFNIDLLIYNVKSNTKYLINQMFQCLFPLINKPHTLLINSISLYITFISNQELRILPVV